MRSKDCGIDFEAYVKRHGEHGVQAIIEGYERREGLTCRDGLPLEDRWKTLIWGRQIPATLHEAA